MQYFLFVLLLLGLSALLVKKTRWLNQYRIPPSLLAGIAVLAFFTAVPGAKNTDFFLHLKALPSEFIALVFACLFLQRREKNAVGVHTHEVVAQTALIWVSVIGQVLIALVATLLVYRPFFGQPLAFTSVLEAGFAGGHGTAVAIGPILAQNGLASGLEYSLFSATVGFVGGIAGGVWLVERQRKASIAPGDDDAVRMQIELYGMLVSLALVAAAYWLGVFYKGVFEKEILPYFIAPTQLAHFSLPLFAYALIGGYTVRQLLALAGFSALIDNTSILFLADFFLEILIFSGIVIIDIRLLGDGLVPLLSLFVLGFTWNLLCHFWLRPRVLPPAYSFELGLINFGMLNGTVATGLMLLKMVDPRLTTPAAKVFAESATLTQPFIAGGVLTLATPYIVTHLSPWLSVLLYGSLLLAWLLVGLSAARRSQMAK